MKTTVVIIAIAVVFNLFDLLTGIIKAFKSDQKLNSTKLRDGIFKKTGFFLLYTFACMLNVARIKFDAPIPIDVIPIVCGYVVFTEIVSITENICSINTDIAPDFLKKLIGVDKGE